MSKTTRYRDPHQWSRSRDHLDPEKASPPMTYDSSLSDDEPVYSDTSRTTSGSLSSHVPMLPSPSRRRIPRRNGIMRNGIMPHRLMRFVCMAVFFALVVFVLNLFRFTLFGRADQVPIDVAKSAPKPHVWESFPFLKRYHGGIRSLVPRNDSVPEYPGDGTLDQLTLSMEEALQQSGEGSDQQGEEEEARKTVQKRSDRLPMASSAFNPYPDYESEEYIQKFGQKVECFLDEDGQVRMPYLHYYPGVPQGFPDAIMGSNEMLGIRDDVCFDRFGRLGPYGLGYGARKGGSGAAMEGDREGSERVWADVPPIDFREVNWAAAQNRCAIANSHRFAKLGDTRLDSAFTMPIGAPPKSHLKIPPAPEETDASGTHHLPRTAVLIRTWHDFPYTEEDILYLRALITELSLMTGGEFTVLFLIHVKDDNLQIWSDEETYDRVLSEALPEEFRGMGILWSERQMNLIYGGLQESFERGLPVHGVYRSTFMPVQYFSHLHPEYDYVWNWEMDVRHTGHWYHFFDKAASWARKQPRKGLWERNSRFYVPSVHGPWEDFMQTVRVQTELGTNTPNNIWSAVKDSEDKSDPNHKDHGRHGEDFIWGPTRPREEDILELETDVIPPTSMEKDRYDWGVGEEADLIVFNPLFDPVGTTWLLRNDVTGYNREDDAPERRAAIITASRLSRKLLMTMHRETSMKRHTMFSEMWPATTALHHGLKAVYVPHSVYIDRKWPTRYVEAVFNAGRNGATGGARTSVFGDREHNFRGTTWFYSAGFSSNLYRRWLGYKVDNDGGEEEELAGEGRLCLPPMLLHPVKDVQLVIDNGDVPDEGEVGESIADDSP